MGAKIRLKFRRGLGLVKLFEIEPVVTQLVGQLQPCCLIALPPFIPVVGRLDFCPALTLESRLGFNGNISIF